MWTNEPKKEVILIRTHGLNKNNNVPRYIEFPKCIKCGFDDKKKIEIIIVGMTYKIGNRELDKLYPLLLPTYAQAIMRCKETKFKCPNCDHDNLIDMDVITDVKKTKYLEVHVDFEGNLIKTKIE